MTAQTSRIDFVPFNDLVNWSVRYLRENRSRYKQSFPLARIGDFLKRNRNVIEIQDDVLYTRVTIRLYTKGVLKRDEELGRNIGTKRQFVVKPGQFIMSKIDARNGAFGLVPPELDGAVTTADFLSYDVDTSRINPSFLTLVSSTKEFLKICQSSSSGTTGRQRVDETQFLNIKIPLPSLEEQDRIVDAYNVQIAEAECFKTKALELQNEMKTSLLNKLGIELFTNTKNKGLILASFTEFSRWDTLYVLGKVFEFKSLYPKVQFKEVIQNFMFDEEGDSLRIETYKLPQDDFCYIGMENVEKDTGKLIDVESIKGNEIKSQTVRVPDQYLIYGKLRPYLNKYWLNDGIYNNCVCSSEFLAFKVNDNLVDRSFFKYVLSSNIVQEQIKDKTSGARMPRINESVFLDLFIPLPPLHIQVEIVKELNYTKSENDNLLAESDLSLRQAIEDFESELFAL